MHKRIFVIINPASGSDQPILNTLNTVFHQGDVDWDIAITKKAGDAKQFAQQAADAGYDIVAAYGGDGTIMEAASGLMGSDVPLAILPGGTANVLSVELGVPGALTKAAGLIVEGPALVRDLDMGLLDDKHLFILRFATGFEAQMVNKADRQLKDRFGKISYTLAGILALRDPLNARYRFTLDGEQVECEGVSCMVANTSNLGIPGIDLARNTSVSDGLLDVIVFRKVDYDSILSILTFTISRTDKQISEDLSRLELTHQWKAKEIVVEADPPQNMIIDGELLGTTPCQIKVLPKVVKILVPDKRI